MERLKCSVYNVRTIIPQSPLPCKVVCVELLMEAEWLPEVGSFLLPHRLQEETETVWLGNEFFTH